jgi:hypothetical protein
VLLQDDPQFVQAGSQVTPGLAFDITAGGRDRGSLDGIRMAAGVMYLGDYRARNIIAAVELGRSFLDG